jgi:hypothetical protein
MTTLSSNAVTVNGYYVTMSGDTVFTKFAIKNLFDLHGQISKIDSYGVPLLLTPYDIISFCFKTAPYINTHKGIDQIDHSSDQILESKGYIFKGKNSSLNAEINAASFMQDSVKKYRSVDIGNGKRIFLSIENDTEGETLQSAAFYTKLHPDKPYLVSSIWLLIKDSMVVERNNRKLNDWVAETISEYKTLSTMVKAKKINAFPWDFKLVVDDYNNWSARNMPDTTSYLKGYIDAQRHYKAIVPFTASYVAGTAFFLPGLFTAVIVAHTPKEQNIKVPKKLLLQDDNEYKEGFQHKAYDKKYRAAAKGSILGGLTCILLLIALA